MVRRYLMAGLLVLTGLVIGAAPACANEPLPVVATFSILGDMVQTVGGERVAVTTLVGPDGDPHVFRPTPRHAQMMAGAELVFANGLGFEGWMERLTDAAGFQGRMVVVSDGVHALAADKSHEHGKKNHDHKAAPDPHAWQDLANAQIYVANIARALIAADPEGQTAYAARRDRYIAELAALDRELKERLARLPPGPRQVVSAHDAFGYFARAYGVVFLAPEGVSTEAEPSARDIALLVRQIRAEDVAAVFLENTSDPRLIEQIRRETDARIGGTLYSGALSGPEGPAATYLVMMRHNIETLLAALHAE